LRNVKSSGPDGLPGTFLFNLKSFLSVPLWLIFRRSLDKEVFPSIWKLSSVPPIFKSGDKSSVKNYIPISILSHIAKLFEKLVLNHMLPSVNSVLIDKHYGFRPGHPAVMNLLVLNNYIFEAFENKCQVNVIFTDFAKAFDRVNHNILLRVLSKSEFGDPLFSGFNPENSLSGRHQWVKINGCKLNVSSISSCVPQGGHISPLLFALFINGVKQIIPNRNFADDL